MARPRTEINKTDFESLLTIQCSEEEIVAFFEHKLGSCSKSTLQRWCLRTYKEGFDQISAKKKLLGKISIRRAQMRAAEKGNPTMLVWLGKQYLNQKDGADTSEQVLAHLDEVLKKMGGVGNDA